ncbi:MAG TPA: DNA repair protein RecN [Gemmatimonadaceae bacterium]|jgi:DNA repair protein RecN (Recombination protein N)|nr:DNA repair protein RecN [Gemmatimonadota bacterium]MBK9406905.1 DNA repair protein RecN [Gemmatimonadota bacterium]MBK9978715.1 DNA repair protein RecN [Gemmatimonadota bacterium]HNV76935.1 DNA repair protein RecN [Gemmatimonadaceae bacterium]
MLTELRIRNVAILESVALPLRPGFNVLSGETGAGKSIIVEALGLLLGERGSADLVRAGADKASVEGVFDAGARPDLLRTLDERGVEVEDGVVVLRREIGSAGRSRAWINGSTVTTATLAEVGRALVNIHGQHESQTLLNPEVQRAVLDAFGGATSQAARVVEAFDAVTAVREQIASLASRRAAAEKRADYLRHVAKELEEARLVAGEEAKLEDEVRRLSHVAELRTHAAHLREAIDGEDESALRLLGAAQRALGSAARLDPALARLQEMLDSAFVQLEELSREVQDYEGALDTDPGRLVELERRRDVVFRLTRKYGGSVESALETLREAREELELVDTAGLDLGTLSQRETELAASLAREAQALSAARVRAARALQRDVDAVFPDLGLADGHLTVSLAARAEVGRSGAEDVEYRVALNVGHEARSLARVASGGELARVMLALKTILARLDGVPTLVFDEVDAGIGGRVGLCVGDTMRRVAEHHQVFAITHLPQIAARAHHHIVVSKGARGGVTTADLRVVDGEARVTEVARMLGGDPESDASRAHARELLESAAHALREAPKKRARGKRAADDSRGE